MMINSEHFRAFLWLRWRLRVNQFRKAGAVNAVFFIIFVFLTCVAAVGLLLTGFLVGLLAMPLASPEVRLLVWDGVVAVFLFFWMIGLMVDVQRNEGLAIDKVLHLPVSPSGAFLINYLSSLFSLTLVAFLPGMLGLILGEVCAGSVAMLLALPLLAAFVLAITAVTYQFQGWLASLMSNPRRRRTVILILTAGFIFVAQLPNLVNVVVRPWDNSGTLRDQMTQTAEAHQRLNEQRAALQAELNAKKITQEEYLRRNQELYQQFGDRQKENETRRKEEGERKWEQFHRTAWIISAAFPPGWVAVGVSDLSAGSVLAALLGTLGFGLIGTASLWRAYRTTVRLYTGEFTGQQGQPAATSRPALPADPNHVRLVERRLPWVSEHVSAVATSTFRSLLRAPEAKMALLGPFIALVVFGGVAFSLQEAPPMTLRPLMAFGAGAMVLLMSGMQLIGNQFGYDRAGFRAFVLSPVPRREILIGKNLALAPLALGMGLAILLVVAIAYPMRIDHYPAALAQLTSAYLVLCVLANALSILAPIPIAPGSMQHSQVKMIPVMLQMLFMMVLQPLATIPIIVPIGIDALVTEVAGVRGVPVSLILSLIVLALAAFLYRVALKWEGELLAAREQAILEVVTSKGE